MGPSNVDDDDACSKQTPFSVGAYLRNAGVRVCA